MHPVLFTIPGIELPLFTYGIMLGLSLVVGWYMVMYLGGIDGLPRDRMAGCYLATAVAALLGARLLYILTNPGEYAGAGIADVLNVRKGGLVAYGGFLGGFVGSLLYLRRHRIRLLPWADVVVPTLGSGLAITRLGCFGYGCCYGKVIPADAPGWLAAIGVRFPNWKVAFPALAAEFERGAGCAAGEFHGAPAFDHHAALGLVSPDAAASLAVYPTQLLDSLNGVVALALALLVRRRLRFRGQVFLAFTMYYGATRPLIELLRGDAKRGGLGTFSTSQIVGVATLAAAIVAYIVLSRRAAADPAAALDLGPGAAERPGRDQRKAPPRRRR